MTARPGWATETIEPWGPGDVAKRAATVRVGGATIRVEQVIDPERPDIRQPVLADLAASTYDLIGLEDCDAQHCRDLAAALLEAARIIEEATT